MIEDTINAACAVDWPRDKLIVEVLDDSTDETSLIIEEVCRRQRNDSGINVQRKTRPNRVGYKAGGEKATFNAFICFVADGASGLRCV